MAFGSILTCGSDSPQDITMQLLQGSVQGKVFGRNLQKFLELAEQLLK